MGSRGGGVRSVSVMEGPPVQIGGVAHSRHGTANAPGMNTRCAHGPTIPGTLARQRAAPPDLPGVTNHDPAAHLDAPPLRSGTRGPHRPARRPGRRRLVPTHGV